MDDNQSEGFRDGISGSSGDPRVVHALNAVLSTVFAIIIVRGLAMISTLAFTAVNVATLAVVLFTVAYVVVS